MAVSVQFGNKIVKLPGSYARLVSGITKEASLSSYNNILLIDAGAGNGFNSIQGIVGNGKGSIYNLDEDSANYYIKGGPLSPVINALFNPQKNKPGIGNLYLLKAATTTPASISGSSISLFGGEITATSIKTVEEGTICNSVLVSSVLRQGFLLKTIYDSNLKKGYIQIYVGSYQGTNFKGYTVGNEEADSSPVLLYTSKKCSTVDELIFFLQRSKDLKAILNIEGLTKVKEFSTTTPSDTDFQFTGGTEIYATDLTDILPYTIDVDYAAMIVLQANDAQTFVPTALDHIVNDAKGIKQLITYAADINDAILGAQEYDSDSCIMITNTSKKTSKTSPTGFIDEDAMVLAAKVVGRLFGLSPEIPGTLKSIDVDGLGITPSDSDLENCLDNGVICPYYDSDLGAFVISQCVNTLQKATELINSDCSTFSIQVKRILAQVIKNLTYQSKIDFWGDSEIDVGANKVNLSDAYIQKWTETLLSKLTYSANKTQNNYLLDYSVIKVETINDAKQVSLSLTVNGEITKIFFIVTVLG